MPITSIYEASRLLRLQLGQESTWGSSATATSILHGLIGLPTITPFYKVEQFDDQRGALTPSFSSAQLALGGNWSHAGNVTFEDVLYTLAGGFGLPTPTLVSPKTITAISIATSAVVTSVAHGLVSAANPTAQVLITGTNSTPVLDGVQTITYVSADTFSVPVHTTGSGSAGSISSTVNYYFVPPVGATFTPLSLTMELGNVAATDCIKALGCLLDTWTITGEMSKPLTYSAKGFFKSAAFSTLTAALGFRSVEAALMPESALYMEAAGGTPGTMAFSGRMVKFELSGTTGLKPVYAGGSLSPTGFTYAKQDLGFKLSLLYDSTLATYLSSNPVAGKPMIVDVKTSSGSKILDLQYSGVLKSDPVYWGDSQSAQIVELDLGPQYDTALANYFKASVTNTAVALP
jgi:hypothetical protein